MYLGRIRIVAYSKARGLIMHALDINKLHKVFANGTVALQEINLKIEEGSFFALLGPNGAGKSTLISIISSLVNKTFGSVKIFKHDLYKNTYAAKACMGLVPQELNFNQFENVIDIVVNQAGFYGIKRSIAYERAEKYLQQLGLWHKRNHMSRSLSGGMKRRLMIARALMHEPRMLILDEPTAGVDIELRRTTWDFLQTINKQGTTIILTTHYLEEAESLCKEIAIIDKGVILEHTKMKNLLAKLPHERIILDLKTPITELKLPDSQQCNLKLIDEATLEITFNKSQTLNEIFDLLSKAGIDVNSMRNKSNRLEELFLNLIAQNRQNIHLNQVKNETP